MSRPRTPQEDPRAAAARAGLIVVVDRQICTVTRVLADERAIEVETPAGRTYRIGGVTL